LYAEHDHELSLEAYAMRRVTVGGADLVVAVER
jgi:hypothetical protein